MDTREIEIGVARCLRRPGPRMQWVCRLGVVLALVGAASLYGGGVSFQRGDVNADGAVDIGDPVYALQFLFASGPPISCDDAADTNDDGSVDIADSVYTFQYLFASGPAPADPGTFTCGPDPTADDLDCGASPPCLARAGHVLNRVAYGPTASELARVQEIGVSAFIEEQLTPEAIDESGNLDLNTRQEALFHEFLPFREEKLVLAGEFWRYQKGTSEPPANWMAPGFDDAAWILGVTGIGFGDGDDRTVVSDMRYAYTSLYLRRTFTLDDPARISRLILRVDYDDAFVAYLNGTEVARSNVRGGQVGVPPAFDAVANGNHEAGTAEDFEIADPPALLSAGDNVLAIHVLNQRLDSGDLSMIPKLVSRETVPGEPLRAIRGIDALQKLVHVRGVYARRQLQTVLAEFWENHFTTEFDKVATYFDDLQNSDASDAMSETQARAEAAQAEFEEYQFFYDNALGSFGDLLLFSATSPAMLIYLDNVLNGKEDPNENYAREILELHAFGVDNGYLQKDIEELARCFTGWSVCKVARDAVLPFPASARTPITACGVQFTDTVVIDLGSGWKYCKGTAEPAPDPGDGSATTAWTEIGFDDEAWLSGSTGIGFGDNDDATVLSDMRDTYLTVYLRRSFEVTDPYELKNLVLEASYDDGFVAYLNGYEVGRSRSMEGDGTPPAYDRRAGDSHEVSVGPDYFNLNPYRDIMVPGTNVLAIQVHNRSISSSDLSMLPRLLDREILPGSIENGDPAGVWTFRFNPGDHDTGTKVLFKDTAYELTIPAGRTGAAGVNDAVDVIDYMVGQSATAEFICIKLIQKFVADELTLATSHAGTARPELLALLDDAMDAWFSTDPPGDIETVMRVLLDPATQTGFFWDRSVWRGKVKTPIEFINSSLRVLNASADGDDLPERNDAMGMHLFTRLEPDGWSEVGFDWVDTGTMLERIDFAQDLVGNKDADFGWDADALLAANGIETADDIVDFFDELLYQRTLKTSTKALLRDSLLTDDNGDPAPLVPGNADYEGRVETFVGLMLSMPHWQFQ